MLRSDVSFSKRRQIVVLAIWLGLVSLPTFAQAKRPENPTPSRRSGEESENARKAAGLFESGQDAHQRGDFEKAIEHYTNALKYDPSLWQVGLQLSSANLSLGRLTPARAAINNVLHQLAPYSDTPEGRQALSRAQVVLGEIALAEAKPEEAETAFRRAVELNAQAYRAQSGLAEVLFSKQQYAEAITAAQQAIELGDQRTATRVLIAEALISMQKYEEALIAVDDNALQFMPSEMNSRKPSAICKLSWA
jgi:tetratricopeptide (TPR) repeat protein